MEKETLEKILPKNSNGKYSRNEIEKAFELGAKWMQEQMYSEEEVMDMFHELSMHLPLHYEFLVKEMFKKK